MRAASHGGSSACRRERSKFRPLVSDSQPHDKGGLNAACPFESASPSHGHSRAYASECVVPRIDDGCPTLHLIVVASTMELPLPVAAASSANRRHSSKRQRER